MTFEQKQELWELYVHSEGPDLPLPIKVFEDLDEAVCILEAWLMEEA